MTKQTRQLRADITSAYAQNARLAELGYGFFGESRRTKQNLLHTDAVWRKKDGTRTHGAPHAHVGSVQHGTQNRTLGMYRVPMSHELRDILAFAHRPLGRPRLIAR